LAGTVIDHMCALIDVRAMSELLVRAEREQRLDLS
ncbi:MAG: chemotaxis protein CheW, partial [Marinobacter sp.]